MQAPVSRPPRNRTAEAMNLGDAGSALAARAAGDSLAAHCCWPLPEWTVSSSLIEVSRAVSELERDIAAHRGSEISDVVTSRLGERAQSVADGLWTLADRIVAADRVGSPPTAGSVGARGRGAVAPAAGHAGGTRWALSGAPRQRGRPAASLRRVVSAPWRPLLTISRSLSLGQLRVDRHPAHAPLSRCECDVSYGHILPAAALLVPDA